MAPAWLAPERTPGRDERPWSVSTLPTAASTAQRMAHVASAASRYTGSNSEGMSARANSEGTPATWALAWLPLSTARLNTSRPASSATTKATTATPSTTRRITTGAGQRPDRRAAHRGDPGRLPAQTRTEVVSGQNPTAGGRTRQERSRLPASPTRGIVGGGSGRCAWPTTGARGGPRVTMPLGTPGASLRHRGLGV